VAVLELRDLTKHYGEHHAVGPVSFTVEEGEFFSLLGPSGCGKTTTLRCIAGFETPTGGDILMDGRSIVDRPVNRRDIGLVFQSYALFPHLTVFDNVAFGLSLRRRPRVEIAERVAEVLALVEMAGYEARHPGQLSGGQQQRVAVARSLALQPRLLLLDEPLSNLDLKLRVQMRGELRKLQRRLRKTTIYVTHDQGEALALSDRIVVLSRGRVEQIGTPPEIYERPRTPFVADFIGSSNLIRGPAEPLPGGGCVVRAAGLALRSAQALPEGIGPGEEVVALLRPERLRLRALGDLAAPEANAFPATVVDVTYLGEDLQLVVEVHGGPMLLASLKVGGGDKDPAPHDSVLACVAPRDVRLLPPSEPR
jgi:putative spermidine/putrescine transport system ATP-binding protein